MQEQELRLKKIKNSCRIIRGFLRIALGIMALFVLMYIWYGIKAAAAPESAFSVHESGNQLRIEMEGSNWAVGSIVPEYAAPGYIDVSYSVKRLQFVNMGLSAVLVLLPFGAVIWLALGILSRVVKGEQPFCTGNIRALKGIGWIMLLLGVAVKAVYLFGIIWLAFGGHTRGMSILMDFGAAFTGGLLLVLVRVFEYGAYLQDEYDATL